MCSSAAVLPRLRSTRVFPVDGGADRLDEIVPNQRLQPEVDGATLHRRYGGTDVTVACQFEYGSHNGCDTELFQHLKAIAIRQADVENDAAVCAGPREATPTAPNGAQSTRKPSLVSMRTDGSA